MKVLYLKHMCKKKVNTSYPAFKCHKKQFLITNLTRMSSFINNIKFWKILSSYYFLYYRYCFTNWILFFCYFCFPKFSCSCINFCYNSCRYFIHCDFFNSYRFSMSKVFIYLLAAAAAATSTGYSMNIYTSRQLCL